MAARKQTRTPTANKPRPVDALNRVVLPAEVREALGLTPGAYVIFKIDGKVVRIQAVTWEPKA